MRKTCYMCDALRTSSEHAPPKFLFPELKDSKDGKDRRKNLITVPSCDKHNSEKSKDDEYFGHVLAVCQGVNGVGEAHFASKVFRAIDRRPALMNALLQQSSPAFVFEGANSQWHDTLRAEVDEKRFYGILEKLGRALYFHNTDGLKWLASIGVIPHFMTSTTPNAKEINRTTATIREASDRLFSNATRIGENPDVFHFSMHTEPSNKLTIIRATFYEGLIVTLLLPDANNRLRVTT